MVKTRQKKCEAQIGNNFDPFAGWREDQEREKKSEPLLDALIDPFLELLKREQQPVDGETVEQQLRRVQLELELCVKLLWRVRTMRRMQCRTSGPGQADFDRCTMQHEAEIDELLPMVLACCHPRGALDYGLRVFTLRDDEVGEVLCLTPS
jgi:hypothetical protein